MILHTLIVLVQAFISCVLGQITTAPICPIQADGWQLPGGLRVQKHQVTTYCDANSKFYCFAPAACLYGHDGYVGCCTAGATCSPRSTCIDYTPNAAVSCNAITDRCVYCSNPRLPACTTQFLDGMYVLGCNTTALTTTISSSGVQSPVLGTSTTTTATLPSSQLTAPVVTSTTAAQPINSPSRTSASDSSSSPSSSSSDTVSSPSTSSQHNPIATSRGRIIGVVIGAAAGSIILLVLLFVLYKWWKQRKFNTNSNQSSRQESNDQLHPGNSNNYTLGSGKDEYTEHDMSNNNSHNPAELDETSYSNTMTGGSASGNGHTYSSYSHSHNHTTTPYSPQDIRGAAEAPAEPNIPFPTWTSPAISNVTSPTPSNSSLWMVGTPRMTATREGYVAYTPSSDYGVYGGQPPSSLVQGMGVERGGIRAVREGEVAELDGNEVGRAQ